MSEKITCEPEMIFTIKIKQYSSKETGIANLAASHIDIVSGIHRILK